MKILVDGFSKFDKMGASKANTETQKMITIKTNNQSRDIIHFEDLNKQEQQDIIDSHGALNADSWSGFYYKGNLHNLDDYMRVEPHNETLKGWDGYAADSAFSGTVIRIVEAGTMVIVGSCHM